MFYTYNQNNSGGSFVSNESVGQYVIVEADSSEEANELAERVPGLYFDGCDNGMDCSCCGDRWYRQYSDTDGEKEPKIYDKTIEEFKKDPGMFAFREQMDIHIYYKDGEHEQVTFDAGKAIEKKKAEKRKIARKLWGNFFSLYMGTRNKNPIRFYEHKYEWGEGKSTFYDKAGNLSIEEGLSFNDDFGVVSFSSANKKEVIEFMEGAEEVLAEARRAALEMEYSENANGMGRKAAAKLLVGRKRR